MPTPLQQTPRRTYRNFIMDSSVWDRYEPRPGDIVISAPAKSGCTWTQRIVSVLVFQQAALPGRLAEISPWLDGGFMPLDRKLATLREQRHRRFIKTHLPVDALPVHAEVSYLITGRDLRDTAVSAHNHMLGMYRRVSAERAAKPDSPTGERADRPEMPEIPSDICDFWREYFTRGGFEGESNGWPVISPTRILESWWPHREAPNVRLLHFQDMLDDLDGCMREVSAFLDVPVNEAVWPELVNACTFAEMKRAEDLASGLAASSAPKKFEFFHKGRNRQWEEFATEEDLQLYRATMAAVPDDLRAWLARSK
jgi:aryl sulfotransferase